MLSVPCHFHFDGTEETYIPTYGVVVLSADGAVVCVGLAVACGVGVLMGAMGVTGNPVFLVLDKTQTVPHIKALANRSTIIGIVLLPAFFTA